MSDNQKKIIQKSEEFGFCMIFSELLGSVQFVFGEGGREKERDAGKDQGWIMMIKDTTFS